MSAAPFSFPVAVFNRIARGLVIALLAFASLTCVQTQAGEDAEFKKAQGLYALQEYKLAADEFVKFIAAYPKSERLDDAKLALAESYYWLKDYLKAAKAFEAYLTDYPQSARRAHALQRALMASSLNKDYPNCLKYAEAYVTENRAKLKAAKPADPGYAIDVVKFATALYRGGDASYELKEFPKAQAFWEELVTGFPESALVTDASEGLGWIYFNAKNFEKAAASFHASADAPKYQRAAWSKLMEGRALAGLNKTDDALAALKLAPTLAGTDKNLEAELLFRSIEIRLNSPKLAEAASGSESLKAIGESLNKLAAEFPELPATNSTFEAAIFRMSETRHDAEAAEFAATYMKLDVGTTKRSAIARLQSRALLALNKTPEAIAAARVAVTQASALSIPALKAEELPASQMLLAELVPAEAPAIFKSVLDGHPGTRFAFNAQYELARMAGEGGRIDEALAQIEGLLEAIAKAPATQSVADAFKRDVLFAAGHFAFHKPDHKKSAEYARAYQKAYGDNDPRADDVARKLAWDLDANGDTAGAVAVLDAALASFPKSSHRDEMLYVRALSANKLNDATTALKYDEELARDFPASSFADDALFDAALILFKQQKFEPSLAKLDALLGKPAPKAELRNLALQLRASARLQSGNATGALADADELLAKGAGDTRLSFPALRLIKAMALLGQPDKEAEALAAFEDLIAKGPADAPEVRQGIARRAYLLFKNKKYAEAKADFIVMSDPAKAATPVDATNAALRLALIHRELKETPQAKALFEKLVEQKLDGVAAFEAPFQLGNILFEAADNANAIKNYERALSNSKDASPASVAAARLNLAWALRRANDKEKAAQAFADVVKNDPTGAYAAEALFERARLFVELGKSADALPLWKEILERFATTPFAEKSLFLQGQIQAQTGNFKEAAESFAAHAEKYPTESLRETLCGLGESRLHLSELDKARDAFEKVLGPKGIEADLEDVNERALLGLADIALKGGDAAAAKKMMLRILAEDAQSNWADAAYFICGQASEILKEPERAIGYYRKLVADRPKSAHVPAAEERLRALGAPK